MPKSCGEVGGESLVLEVQGVRFVTHGEEPVGVTLEILDLDQQIFILPEELLVIGGGRSSCFSFYSELLLEVAVLLECLF
jgi:hypothetical protein